MKKITLAIYLALIPCCFASPVIGITYFYPARLEGTKCIVETVKMEVPRSFAARRRVKGHESDTPIHYAIWQIFSQMNTRNAKGIYFNPGLDSVEIKDQIVYVRFSGDVINDLFKRRAMELAIKQTIGQNLNLRNHPKYDFKIPYIKGFVMISKRGHHYPKSSHMKSKGDYFPVAPRYAFHPKEAKPEPPAEKNK